MIVSLNIPDGVATRVVDAFAVYYHFETEAQTGETKAQFAKRMLVKHIKEVVLYSVEGEQAVTVARQAQKDNINSAIDIT